MTFLALLFLMQSGSEPWKPWQSDPVGDYRERLGPGPHTLVISDGSAITRIDYKTGPACQKARDEVRRQAMPSPQRGLIVPIPRIQAVCVPR